MALSRKTAAIIEIVAKDAQCINVINKSDIPRIVQAVSPWLAMAGAFRNAGMMTYESYNNISPQTSEDSGSAYMMDRICQGIANSVQSATSKAIYAKKLYEQPQSISHSIFRKFATIHFWSLCEQSRGDRRRRIHFGFSWMTLEIRNPMVWHYREWRNYPMIAGTVGCPFKLFCGF